MTDSDVLCAAIFDMDGLLFDTESAGRWAWTDALYSRLVGKDMATRRRILCAHFGDALSFEQAKARRLALGDARERSGGLAAKPGARELVAALAAAGVRRGRWRAIWTVCGRRWSGRSASACGASGAIFSGRRRRTGYNAAMADAGGRGFAAMSWRCNISAL